MSIASPVTFPSRAWLAAVVLLAITRPTGSPPKARTLFGRVTEILFNVVLVPGESGIGPQFRCACRSDYKGTGRRGEPVGKRD